MLARRVLAELLFQPLTQNHKLRGGFDGAARFADAQDRGRGGGAAAHEYIHVARINILQEMQPRPARAGFIHERLQHGFGAETGPTDADDGDIFEAAQLLRRRFDRRQ